MIAHRHRSPHALTAAQQGITSALLFECPSLNYRATDARAVALLLYWSPVLWPLYFVARTNAAQSAISLYAASAPTLPSLI